MSLQEALVLARTLAVGLPALVAGDPETDVDGHQLVELRAVIDPGIGLEEVRESLKTNIVATRSNEAVDAAARRFGRTAGEIEVAAKRIWGHRFEAEYRRRLAAIPEDARPHTVSALKATALRSMYAEIRKAFEEA